MAPAEAGAIAWRVRLYYEVYVARPVYDVTFPLASWPTEVMLTAVPPFTFG